MKYLIYNDNAAPNSRSETIASELGCGQSPGDVTVRWFDVIVHPSNRPASALQIPQGHEHLLTDQERQALKDETYMVGTGWLTATL